MKPLARDILLGVVFINQTHKYHMNTFEQTLLEHCFARVIRILWGDVPNVKRIGIMTANNPQYKQLSQKENESRNRQLMAWLRTSGFGPIKIKGKFTQSDEGKEEDSLLIPHIRRDILLSWARHKDVDQGAVIWGQKKEDEDSNPYFDFEWIDCNTGQTTQHRYVTMSGDDIPARLDAYSKVKGRKFVIPFWGDKHKDKLPGQQRGTIQEPSHIPDVRPSARDVAWHITAIDQGGDDVLFSETLPTKVAPLIEEIRRFEKLLYGEGITGKGRWVAMGNIDQLVNDIKAELRKK